MNVASMTAKLEPPKDIFTDTAAILYSIVSNSYYGILRGQMHTDLPSEHPVIAI